jgi:hypothetical protein
MSLTKLPLGKNNSVMTSIFPPRESLVVTSRLGTGNSRTFFTVYITACRGRAMATSDSAVRVCLGYRCDRRLQLGRSGQLIQKKRWPPCFFLIKFTFLSLFSYITGERCVLGGMLLQPRLMQLSHEGAGSLPHPPHHHAAPQAPPLVVREQAAFLIPLITMILLRLLL